MTEKRWIDHEPGACGKIAHPTRESAERQLADLLRHRLARRAAREASLLDGLDPESESVSEPA